MTRIGSLCSGYGGLDLGLLAHLGPNASVAWHAEYDENPAKILAHHWPDVPNLRDVTAADWSTVEPVDWLTAGYPCQPFSLAGKRKGATDERHLWPYIASALGVLRPRRVLLENVAGHVSMGLGAVVGDLAALGYDAQWCVVRASDAGAPHRRERIFIVAQDTHGAARGERRVAAPGQAQGGRPRPDTGRRGGVSTTNAASEHERPFRAGDRGGQPEASAGDQSRALAADADVTGSQGSEPARGHDVPAWGAYQPAIERWARTVGRPAPLPTELGTRGGQRLSPAFVEWLMGLPAGHVTDVPGLTRNAQLKALGNGVVPQQAALALRLLLPPLEERDSA